MSHIAITYHIVIGTYRRRYVIDIDHERELYKFMYDYLSKKDVYVRRIGGMPDHVHILCDIPPKHAVASMMQTLKTEASKFMKVNSHFPDWYGWAEGYGAFSVDPQLREVRKQYIMNQKRHHANLDFASEYRQLLNENGMSDVSDILGDESHKSVS